MFAQIKGPFANVTLQEDAVGWLVHVERKGNANYFRLGEFDNEQTALDLGRLFAGGGDLGDAALLFLLAKL